MSDYATFLLGKRWLWRGGGIDEVDLPAMLFDWQRAIVHWALRKGRSAIFADCGLGKTPMQLAWAQAVQAIGLKTLVLAPLCVAEQTVAEGAKFGIPVHYAADASSVGNHPIVITNYERLERFDVSQFGAVVLDESSILKAFDGKTRKLLIETFKDTPYRLCCTATPAPNDIAELANHAEFLGLVTRAEFLATWFVHDDAGWRMKKHAKLPFYRWLASWAVALRSPADIGFSDAGFQLPTLSIRDVIVESPHAGHSLFPEIAVKGITGRMAARRGSLEPRVAAATELVTTGKPWLIWCGLNPESEAMTAAVDGVEVKGSDSYASKVGAVRGFQAGTIERIVSKVRILGFGLNFQHCADMVFMGLGDSYEQYYQAIRRCWRFGQTHDVTAWIVVSEAEQAIVENVRRKERDARELGTELLHHMRDFEREELETVA